jgi:hypothetical protein
MTLVTAAAIAVFAVGCGSGGDSTSTAGGADATTSSNASEAQAGGTTGTTGSASSSGKAAFVKQASATCEEARKGAFDRIAAYEKTHGSAGSSGTAVSEAAVRAVLLGTIKAEIDGIDAAGSGTGYEQPIETVVSEMQTIFNEASQDSKLSPTEIEDVFGVTDKTLRKLGLRACSKSG